MRSVSETSNASGASNVITLPHKSTPPAKTSGDPDVFDHAEFMTANMLTAVVAAYRVIRLGHGQDIAHGLMIEVMRLADKEANDNANVGG